MEHIPDRNQRPNPVEHPVNSPASKPINKSSTTNDSTKQIHNSLISQFQNQSPANSIELELESDETLFENYEPRSVSTIISQQLAMKDSLAAEAAAIILHGVVSPNFIDSQDQIQIPDSDENAELYGMRFRQIRVQKLRPVDRLLGPGAQLIYALIIVTLLGGLLGLAATLQTPMLVLLSGIMSPILIPICIWKWVRWLDSSPYYYRLLTSLGEDARNLLQYRLLWKRSDSRL